MTTWGEESILSKMSSILNDNLQRLSKLVEKEKNVGVLRHMSDIILSFICNPLEENVD